MNKQITFDEIAQEIAQSTHTSKRTGELFLKELFGIVAQKFIEGENVRIKGLGTFTVTTDDAGAKSVAYAPDSDLADGVNYAFAQFQPVELDDSVTDADLAAIDEAILLELGVRSEELGVASAPTPTSEESPAQNSQNSQNNDAEDTPAEEEQTLEEGQFSEASSSPRPSEASPGVKDTEEAGSSERPNVTATDEKTEEEHLNSQLSTLNTNENRPITLSDLETLKRDITRRSMLTGFLAGLLTMLVAAILAWLIFGRTTPAPNPPGENPAQNSQTEELNSQLSTLNTEKTDVVTEDIYLSTLAQKHYGNPIFWIYIYQENAAIIKNPDAVPPGTQVTIPAPAKYGIDANDPQSVARAKQLSDAHYAK